MIEGIRHSRAKKIIFAHNNLFELERLLASVPLATPKLIAFESVYSMSGSIGHIEAICDLAKKYNALTFLDEVHAVGMYGATGAGIAQQLGPDVMDRVDIVSGKRASMTVALEMTRFMHALTRYLGNYHRSTQLLIVF